MVPKNFDSSNLPFFMENTERKNCFYMALNQELTYQAKSISMILVSVGWCSERIASVSRKLTLGHTEILVMKYWLENVSSDFESEQGNLLALVYFVVRPYFNRIEKEMEGKINEAFQNDTYLSYYDHKKAMAKVDDLPGVGKFVLHWKT